MNMSENQKEWEESYGSSGFRNKNQYPDIDLVSFVMNRFGSRPDKKNIRILELGCGWGNNLRFFKDQGFSYTGVDFSRSAIQYCLLSHKNVFEMDFRKLDFQENAFDCVIDRMAIQHNPKQDLPLIFESVYKILKKEGVFLTFLIEKADYNFVTSYLQEEEIRNLTKNFHSVEIDYMERSYSDQKSIVRTNIATCTK